MKEGCKVSRKAHKTNFVGNTFKIGNVVFFKTNFEYCAESGANTVFYVSPENIPLQYSPLLVTFPSISFSQLVTRSP